MHKHLAALVRADGVDHERFRDAWLDQPPAWGVDAAVGARAVVPTDPANAEFDGIAELLFPSADALEAALGAGAGTAPTAPFESGVEALIDASESVAFVGEEVVQKSDAEATDGLYKHSALLVRKSGMDHASFREYWEHEHTPLARDIEGVVRYHTVYASDPDRARFDGVAELYFETLEAVHAALGSPGSRDYDPTKDVAAQARADVDNFLAVERRPRLIGRERVRLGGG